jgi:hypothetical protein
MGVELGGAMCAVMEARRSVDEGILKREAERAL